MQPTSFLTLPASVALAAATLAQAPATLTVTADVGSNTATFSDSDYNAVQPGQPVTFTCAIDVVPFPSPAPHMTYDLGPTPMTLNIGIDVATGPVAPLPGSVFGLGDATNPAGRDVLGVVAEFGGNVQFVAVATAPNGGITTSDLLTQNGSVLLTGLGSGMGSLSDTFVIQEVAGSSPAPRIDLMNVAMNLVVPPALGTAYCTTVPNSTGETGSLTIAGSPVAAANECYMLMHNLPAGQFGMAVTSMTQASFANPNGQGNICLGGDIGRFNGAGQLQLTDSDGFASFQVDLTAVPQAIGLVSVLPGQTWNYQFWHRDFVGGAQSSNLTNPISVSFL